MRISFLCLLLSIALTAYSQQPVKPVIAVESPRLLEQAYKDQSKEELAQFLSEWSTSIPPVSESELQQMSPRHQEAYRAFTAFYKPHRLDSLGGSEWGNNVYEDTKFLLVQNFIVIRVDSAETRDSISNFRPIIAVPNKQCIYLTPTREANLVAFLGNKHTKLGAGGIMNPAHSSGESEKRKRFLESFLKIWYGHWGGYWQLNSYPVAYAITFDKHMLTARISFRMVYEGGEAVLQKRNGRWQLVSSQRTWIE